MAISIHYKGKIDDKTKVQPLIEEIQDIADTMNWPYYCLNEDWKKKSQLKLEHREDGAHILGHAALKGISFTPHPKSETVWLFFDDQGNISSPISIVMREEDDSGDFYWLAVKTQFAGVEIHIAIIELFKYLKNKYISNLEVVDEGEFWETGNELLLKSKINQLHEAIHMINSALSGLSIQSKNDTESVVRKIERLLRNMGFERSPEEDL